MEFLNDCLILPVGRSYSPIGYLPRWWIGKCLPDMAGTGEMIYRSGPKYHLLLCRKTLTCQRLEEENLDHKLPGLAVWGWGVGPATHHSAKDLKTKSSNKQYRINRNLQLLKPRKMTMDIGTWIQRRKLG